MEDIEVWKQMYRTVFIAADKALTLLENMCTQEAMETLQSALLQAEDLFIAAEGTVDERTEQAMKTFRSALAWRNAYFAAVEQRAEEIAAYADSQDYTKNKDEKS